jgi:hypothetical protein
VKQAIASGACALLLLVTSFGPAQAQLAAWERNIVEARTKKDEGVVLIDVAPKSSSGRPICVTMVIWTRPVGGGSELGAYRVGKGWAWAGYKHGGFIKLAPGRYEVTKVQCREMHDNEVVLPGPFARFEVRAGELTDLGVLHLEYALKERTGFLGVVAAVKLRKSVTGMSPAARTQLKESLPTTIGFMVTRHMTLIGPAVVDTKVGGL